MLTKDYDRHAWNSRRLGLEFCALAFVTYLTESKYCIKIREFARSLTVHFPLIINNYYYKHYEIDVKLSSILKIFNLSQLIIFIFTSNNIVKFTDKLLQKRTGI